MPSSKTTVKSVRLRNDTLEKILNDKENQLNRVIESLYDAVSAGKVSLKNSEVVFTKKSANSSGVHTKKGVKYVELPDAIYESLSDTLAIDEISVEDFLKAVTDAVDEGLIWLENGKIVVENAQ